MLSYYEQTYIPIAMECEVVPFKNEMIKLQEKRIIENKFHFVKPLIDGNLIKQDSHPDN